jgi:signal transduction histidine kinase
VLGVLRAEDGQDPSAPLVPEPDFSRLVGLAASVTSQGVEVSLTNAITDAPKAVQLATYRIVQEALTNVVRHAHATRATVDISLAERTYLIAIADDGRGVANERDLTSGRGLLGMRERAELLGGTLEVTRSPLGGLLVLVAIPQKEHVE